MFAAATPVCGELVLGPPQAPWCVRPPYSVEYLHRTCTHSPAPSTLSLGSYVTNDYCSGNDDGEKVGELRTGAAFPHEGSPWGRGAHCTRVKQGTWIWNRNSWEDFFFFKADKKEQKTLTFCTQKRLPVNTCRLCLRPVSVRTESPRLDWVIRQVEVCFGSWCWWLGHRVCCGP